MPGDEPDDQYPLAATSGNYTVQAWWLHNNGKMYEGDLGKSPGNIGIPASGGNQTWTAAQAAATDTIYPTDTWVGQLTFASAPGTNSITVEIGMLFFVSGNLSGGGPVGFGPEATIGDGVNKTLVFETDASSITIPAGGYLRLRITDNDTSNHTLLAGGAYSYVSHTSQVHTLASYSDAAHNKPCNDFADYDTEHTVYMYGTGLLPSHNYLVAYYDGSGGEKDTDNVTSDASGNVSSEHTFVPSIDVAGSWNVIICEPNYTPPTSYNGTWSYTITSDSFNVEETAIPEFPTVMAAIVAFSLCVGVYFWMRRRATAVPLKA